MIKSILIEAQFFMICAFNGFIIIMFYDILKFIRSIIKHNKVTEAVEDLLFGIFAGFKLFVVIYEHNDGILRAFLVIAIGLGMGIYQFLRKLCTRWIKQKE